MVSLRWSSDRYEPERGYGLSPGWLRKDGSDVLTADTRIIIAPGYRYRVVDAMVTNFHQPKSTLLLLVSAFNGGDWRRMYDLAMEREFRFLSYGDACLLL